MAQQTGLDDLSTLERVAERARDRSDWATAPPHKLLALVAELRRAREARDQLHEFYGDLDADDATAMSAYRLSSILRVWDGVEP